MFLPNMNIVFAILLLLIMHKTHANVIQDTFGSYIDDNNKENVVSRFTLKNNLGTKIQIINYGAIITSINVADRNGDFKDIDLGFDNIKGYIDIGNNVDPHFGATIGRCANRIGNSTFYINGKKYTVTPNLGRDHLHGGKTGFDKKLWESYVIDNNKVAFTYVSPDGEEGYPGTVFAQVLYSLNEQNYLNIDMIATSSKKTPVNLVNHAYFNLAGHNSGSEELLNHEVLINADHYLPTVESIPTGEIKSVKGTEFDLRTAKVLKTLISSNFDGFDQNFCVNNISKDEQRFVAKVTHNKSGRVLTIFSNQPGVQFYTSNSLPTTDIVKGKENAIYKKHDALCLETQSYPDAVNKPNFPNTILEPGRLYKHSLSYRFSVTK